MAQPCRLKPAPSGTTTLPEAPLPPLWMWEALGAPSILVILVSQQTLPADRKTLLALLTQLVDLNNEASRVPLRAEDALEHLGKSG